MSTVPVKDSSFDALLSSHVVQHGLQKECDFVFQEMYRILRPNGILFLRTISTQHLCYGRGQNIEPNTFINIPELPDGKVPHHFYSAEEIEQCLGLFNIISKHHSRSPPAPKGFWKYGLEEWIILARKK